MGGLFNKFLYISLRLYRYLFKSKMGLFVYAIFTKWYMMVTIGSIIVTFLVFQGFFKLGIIQKAEKVMIHAINSAKAISYECVPKILRIGEFWYCMQNAGDYKETDEEKKLYEYGDKIQKNIIQDDNLNNPYSQ